MEEWIRFNLPASQKGHEWTYADIERAKDWFSQHCLESAVSLAYVQLSIRGFPRVEMAEDCVSEWLCGRVDSSAQLLPSRFGRAIRSYDPEKGSLHTFLLHDLRLYVSGTVVRRLLVELRIDPIDSLLIEDSGPDLRTIVSIKDVTLRVMARLDEREQKMLIFTDKGHSIDEIASLLGCSNNAVKTAISRARRHAREEMDRLTQ